MPMTARTAGARDDELDRFKNTKALPHRWLRPSTGPADGNGDVLDEQVLTIPSRHHPPTHPPRHHTHQGALNDDELTRRLRDFKPSGAR
jgi:hypothetical protein